MKKLFFALTMGCLLAFNAAAQHSDKETKEDIQRHRAMAAAHEAAAKCLESGKKEDVSPKNCRLPVKAWPLAKPAA